MLGFHVISQHNVLNNDVMKQVHKQTHHHFIVFWPFKVGVLLESIQTTI